MKKIRKVPLRLLALTLCLLLLLTACSNGNTQSSVQSSDEKSSSDSENVKMTDVGTPRAETLIIDMLQGREANPTQLNYYAPGVVYTGNGFRQFVNEPLWDVDSIKGEQIPILAEGMAEPVDDTYTKFNVKLKEGVKWSDGVELTSEDVVFTSDMLLNSPELAYSQSFAATIKGMSVIDKYTFQIETVKRETRIEQFLGVTVTNVLFQIVPKHIWENVDPNTYLNDQAIGSGPYIFKEADPQGNWFLFEKRQDWEACATSMIYGEPKPNYILFRTYGSEEKRVMAAIQNDIDILCDISPESWTVLSEKNPEAMAWYSEYPYADMDDPGGRGILFNCAQAPFDDVDIRWAMLLAIDINSASLSTFSGMLRVTPLILAPTTALTKAYHEPMTPWLKDLTLSDGYKPFDENFATNMVETLEKQGIGGLPDDAQKAKDIFGVGWWKYDPAQAEKILLSKGYSRDSNGKWLKPDGSVWQVNMAIPSGFELIAERMGYAIIDSWQKFGIDAVAQPCDNATYQSVNSTGSMDCSILWPSMSVISDAIGGLRTWHSDNIVEIGENTPSGWNSGAAARYKSDKLDEILDELASLTSDDPRIIELTTEFQKELVINAPFAGVFGTSKLVPVTTHYWKNFQTSENAFEGPWWWWSNFRSSVYQYEPTGNQ